MAKSLEMLGVDAVCGRFGHEAEYSFGHIGACAIDRFGDPYPEETHLVFLNHAVSCAVTCVKGNKIYEHPSFESYKIRSYYEKAS